MYSVHVHVEEYPCDVFSIVYCIVYSVQHCISSIIDVQATTIIAYIIVHVHTCTCTCVMYYNTCTCTCNCVM